MLTGSQASLLRLISIGDESFLRSGSGDAGHPSMALDDRTASLVRLASLVAGGAPLPAFQREVHAALDAGASVDEILSLLLVLCQPAGTTAVISAAPKLAMALDYDVDAGLEELAT